MTFHREMKHRGPRLCNGSGPRRGLRGFRSQKKGRQIGGPKNDQDEVRVIAPWPLRMAEVMAGSRCYRALRSTSAWLRNRER